MPVTQHTEPTYSLDCDECDYRADEEGDGIAVFGSEKQALEWADRSGWLVPDPMNGGPILCVGCRVEHDENEMQRQEITAAIMAALPNSL